MSVLTYNNIDLSYVLTRSHDMGPVKDDSGSDQILTQIRIEVVSLISAGMYPTVPGETNPAQTLVRIRHMLTQPRAPLVYGLADNELIVDLPGGRDDAGGPWPDETAFRAEYTTPDTILVSFAVTVKLKDCGTTYPTAPLSLRWEDSFSMDERFRGRWERRGTGILSTRSTFTVDYMRRNMIAPVVAPGFARTSSQMTMSRDGLRCDFEFVDEQIRWAPPYPAIDMSIVQSETTTETGMGMRFGQVEVEVDGAIGADINDLKNIAARVATARIFAVGNLLKAQGTVLGKTELATREDKSSVTVSLTRSYKITPGTTAASPNTQMTTWSLPKYNLATAVNPYLGSFTFATDVIQNLRQGNVIQNTTAQGQPGGNLPIDFNWVGYGTSAGNAKSRQDFPAAVGKPAGFADWARPSGSQNTFPDGFTPLAQAVGLWAAALRDPCGSALAVNPNALNGQPAAGAPIRTTVTMSNSSAGGSGGQPYISQATFNASQTALAASEYPTTIGDNDAPTGYAAELAPGHYTTWQCIHEYTSDPGTVVVPVCDPGGVNVAVQHSSNLVTLRKRWVAEREGSPPLLPTKNIGTNWVLVDQYRGLRDLRRAPDGQSWVYKAEGVYTFAALDPTLVDEYADTAPYLVPSQAAYPAVRGWSDDMVQRRLVAANTSFGGTSQLQVVPTIGAGPPVAGVYDVPASYVLPQQGVSPPGPAGTPGIPQPGDSTQPNTGTSPLGGGTVTGPSTSSSPSSSPFLGLPTGLGGLTPGVFLGSTGPSSSNPGVPLGQSSVDAVAAAIFGKAAAAGTTASPLGTNSLAAGSTQPPAPLPNPESST